MKKSATTPIPQVANALDETSSKRSAYGPRGRGWILGLSFLLTAGATWAILEFLVWKKIPTELIGKWVVVGGKQDGATFEFDRSGRMRGVVNVRGREGRIDAHVRVEGASLFSTTRNPTTGEEETRRQRIHKLTATEFVLEDERGQLLHMERVD